MDTVTKFRDRRTNVEQVFAALYDDIITLQLLPGDKISEADIATRLGVSRQPVRDAFSRLENLDLLVIRPQKATEVKRFSLMAIEQSRFVRAAVEAEVLRRAAAQCDEAGKRALNDCLAQQRQAVADNDYQAFGVLDYAFHRILCEIARVGFAYDVISAEKGKLDRLCVLGLSKEDRMPQLLSDHIAIAERIIAGDGEGAVAAGKLHLSRLDETIDTIYTQYPSYFDA